MVPKRWKKLSLRVKAIALVLLATIPALGIVAASGIQQVRRQITVSQNRTVQTVAQYLASASELALAVRDTHELTRIARTGLGDEQTLFVAVYDAHENLLASAVRDQATWERYKKHALQESDAILARQSVQRSGETDKFSPEIGRAHV